ncbi:hypothetical protein M3P05_01715 [Sansalvadorimonas sp. 2012CJ34-2]|uniref:Uncharacterized protein n=1 Tax=Parendozoicomonas callyspongiae TaxID=2942213 RepID=A0ABT0PBC9_9GAMM|nr:hypothetical protein [Sansalvadorimonas sp. 2012CJ34-2]MCL6268670.1 hypothetical protein [Sansalvadorimonas sp. 2012CJ34-2]
MKACLIILLCFVANTAFGGVVFEFARGGVYIKFEGGKGKETFVAPRQLFADKILGIEQVYRPELQDADCYEFVAKTNISLARFSISYKTLELSYLSSQVRKEIFKPKNPFEVEKPAPIFPENNPNRLTKKR